MQKKMTRRLGPYQEMMLERVLPLGGFYNAHAHLDRADTLKDKYLEHNNTTPIGASAKPLEAKQNMTGDLHLGLAYTADDLRERMSECIERLLAYDTYRVDTCIDASPDIGEKGLLAFRIAWELKRKYADRIDLRLAPNPIFGFKEGTPRWEVFCEAAKSADYLSALPEKDEFADPRSRDGKIGFETHIRRVIELGYKLGKEVQLHLDQMNSPNESGTEILLRGLQWLDTPVVADHSGPTIWVIHALSPSCYDEDRFARLIEQLQRHNVGIIVCPGAALSMRQLRPEWSPTHNSIARILEFVKAKIPIRLGSDNIADLFVPQTSGDMLEETVLAGISVRFNPPSVWAKIAAGKQINAVDIAAVGEVLYQDRKVFEGIDGSWRPAIE